MKSAVIPFVFLFSVALHAWAVNPEVKIASGPLTSGRSNLHPNMLLSLSVEYATGRVAYRGDSNYNRTYEYTGYFNPLKCYGYNVGNRNLAEEGSLNELGYFHILKDASALHECGGDSFSGNFMNWAASSTIDILRYALTGGDRVYDAADATILQRAFLNDAETDNFYAHSTWFPRREISAGGNVSAPKQVTPFSAKTLYIVSCRNRILFGDRSSGLVGNQTPDSKLATRYCTSSFDKNKREQADDAKDKNLGEYLVRVRVCDSMEGPTRTDLCHKYGKNYKPVGAIQRKSGKLRLAAMGYLLDDAETRYGGVLRAPMKHVGPKKLEAPGFIETDNDKLEWDVETGVFYNNPDEPGARSSTLSNSGVINYLNKFGRSGARAGIYKRYDPVGELYYEGIRYLQGLQGTPDATKELTEAMTEGFPVHTEWADPVIASCQENYIVSIADANTHWDRHIPGNLREKYGGNRDAHDKARPVHAVAGKTPELDVRVWTDTVGAMESDATGTYTNPAPNKSLSDLANKDTGSEGHGTYYMAGLAYWANTNDIRLDKPARVKTFTIDVDEGGNGLIDGSGRSIQPRNSQLYLAAKYGGFDDKNKDGNPFKTYLVDGKTEVTRSNAEWDYNGGGVPDNYFLAGTPEELMRSVRKVFDMIGQASGMISSVAVSSTKISSDGVFGVFVYQPGFDASTWSGSLKKLRLNLDSGNSVKIDTSAPSWDAGEILTGTTDSNGKPLKPAEPSPDARNLYTAKITEANSLSTIEFKWDKLTDAQKALLDLSPVGGGNDGLGEKRLNYLRGDRSLELGRENGKVRGIFRDLFRTRNRVLGDLINSNPTYVGSPAANVQGAGYQEFYKNHEKRAKAVYVGANDGMLHAFDAADGKELFAYVPNALFGDLNQLTGADYAHRPYVDGALTVAEAQVRGNWKTVLASGMGGGAQGLFALDVSNPSNFIGGDGAIWEFTDADDPDMGNITGAPVIARFRVPGASAEAEYRYFVVVPSGLNNYKEDGARGDGTKKFNADAAGALFLLSLDKKASEKWEPGKNYYKFRTPSTDSDLKNGLSSPALVVDTNGAVRYAYAGDLQGNLWRFDFTGSFSNVRTSDMPLFVAKDGTGTRQPITIQPKVVFAPGGGYVVLFGTGKFVEDSDAAPGNFEVQSFYAIYDTTHGKYSVSGRTQLAPRRLEKDREDTLKITGDPVSYGTTGEHKKGWYFDFHESKTTGERSVTNPLIANGVLFFNTLMPGADPCAAGSGRSYVLDTLTGLPLNGQSTGFLSRVGTPSSPVLIDIAADVSARNAVGRRTVKKKQSVLSFGPGGVQGTAGPAEPGWVITTVPAGRFSWREIPNWQELRDALTKSN